MVIAIIPAERYIIHPESGVNLTLQTACQAISDSFNRLSATGVPIVDPASGAEVTYSGIFSKFLISYNNIHR